MWAAALSRAVQHQHRVVVIAHGRSEGQVTRQQLLEQSQHGAACAACWKQLLIPCPFIELRPNASRGPTLLLACPI